MMVEIPGNTVTHFFFYENTHVASNSNSKKDADSVSVTDHRVTIRSELGQWKRTSERSDRANKRNV